MLLAVSVTKPEELCFRAPGSPNITRVYFVLASVGRLANIVYEKDVSI